MHIACLCAAWCRLCDGYCDVINQVARELECSTPRVHWHWVDIEDEADLLGDADIETFPTLVAFDAEHVYFAGVVEPQPETLRRLVRAWQAQALAGRPAVGIDPALAAFAAAWQRRIEQADSAPGASADIP